MRILFFRKSEKQSAKLNYNFEKKTYTHTYIYIYTCIDNWKRLET